MKSLFCAVLSLFLLLVNPSAGMANEIPADGIALSRVTVQEAARGQSADRQKLTFPEKKAFLGRLYPFRLLNQKYSPAKVRIPVLLYHNIGDTKGSGTLSREDFAAHMAALRDNGYATVSLRQLMDYVHRDFPLPEKPVCITFDDGYLSNYTLAFPILRENKQKAAIFIIGHSVGKDEYKDTGIPIIPHFTYAQAKEMVDSGLISIESHTHDMHPSHAAAAAGKSRKSFVKSDTESILDYQNILSADIQTIAKDIHSGTGVSPIAFAFPKGEYDDLSQKTLKELGMQMTFRIHGSVNTLVQGNPDTLQLLNRFYVVKKTTPQDILDYIGGTAD